MRALGVCVLTVSDTRGDADDQSGDYLCDAVERAGHRLVERGRVVDDIEPIREVLGRWTTDPNVEVCLLTGGTGITARDVTPEAVEPLIEKRIDGFGELFRQLSFGEIGASTLQSRAVGGLVNRRLVFCLPGSPGACRLGWERILKPQLDSETRPCNFAELLSRL